MLFVVAIASCLRLIITSLTYEERKFKMPRTLGAVSCVISLLFKVFVKPFLIMDCDNLLVGEMSLLLAMI